MDWSHEILVVYFWRHPFTAEDPFFVVVWCDDILQISTNEYYYLKKHTKR